MIDSMRVQQILINLIANAIKFSRANSLVKVVLSSYSTQFEDTHRGVEVQIIDSGIGIS